VQALTKGITKGNPKESWISGVRIIHAIGGIVVSVAQRHPLSVNMDMAVRNARVPTGERSSLSLMPSILIYVRFVVG
jgi:hypothetical protein